MNVARPYHRFLYQLCAWFFLSFLLYVGSGYYYGFAAWFPGLPASARFVVALAAAALVGFLVLHLAAAFHGARQVRSGRLSRWLFWYLGLFFVSGLGFVLASMLLFEGPTVVRENLTKAVTALNSLQSSAHKWLPVPDYTDAIARLQREKVDLHEEITNAATCGVGDQAKRIIEQIKSDIPDFVILRDTDHSFNCNDPRQRALVREIAQQYDRKVNSGLEELARSEKYANFHVIERNQLGGEIDATVGGDLLRLHDLQEQFVNVWTFIGRLDLHRKAVSVLERAASDYGAEYQKLADLVGAAKLTELPPALDIAAAQNIASPPSLMPNLVARSGRGTTWVYIIIALLADGLAAYMWAAAMLVLLESVDTAPAANDGRVEGSDVRYLWVPAASRSG